MSGWGSGTWYGGDGKDTVESRCCIDVHWCYRQGWFHPGQWFGLRWLHADREIASIVVQTFEQDIELRYSVTARDGTRRDMQYRVRLDWSPCTYGGRRPWFLCPDVPAGTSCGRRVAKLYYAGHYFRCRHCHDLTYESRRESPQMRALSRVQAIRRQLGGNPSTMAPFPDKPKGMHWRTYLRLQDAHDRAHRAMWMAIAAGIEEMDA